MRPEATPWRTLIAAANQLGIAPREFWRLSLREWRALTAPHAADTLSRAAFENLAERYPDHTNDQH